MNVYTSPFTERYASQEMKTLFSPQFKYSTWRRLWVALAQAEQSLGLPIDDQQIEEMEAHTEDIDWQKVADYEKKFEHDVVAHLHAYGDLCPRARPIIHLGATSCYVTDNTDLIQIREGLQLILSKLASVIQGFSLFARRYAALPCLGFTHFQAAQPTTIGKRACLWIQDLLMDFHDLENRLRSLRFLGAKGTTGTQASFKALLNGGSNVEKLDHLIAEKMGFTRLFLISGQTYTRKQDSQILNALAGIAISAHKIGTDLRLLAHLKEIEEPFGESQVGSSAMPYKRNPILSERICSLARYLIALTENTSYTAATQWLERSLDDSANRRLCIPEAFLCCDAILEVLLKLSSSLVVHETIIARHLAEELPFIATENILMECVKRGGDRQDLHSKIRVHSHAANQQMKEKGLANDLLERIAADEVFGMTLSDLEGLADINDFIGRAPEQVEEFLVQEVAPTLVPWMNTDNVLE
jgi:adenylosuccinate lyase